MPSIAIAPRTRTQVTDRLNHVLVPAIKDSAAIGSTYPLGSTPFPDTASASINTSNATPYLGGTTAQVVMSKSGTNIGAKLLEQNLSVLQMGVNTTYTASLWVRSPKDGPNPKLLINGAGVAAAASVVTAVKDAWTRLSVTFTTSSGGGLLSAYLFFDSAGFNGAYTLFDCFAIDDGANAQAWFDGEGAYPAIPDDPTNGKFYTKWLGTRYNSVSALYHFDPTEVAYPILTVGGFHAGKDNGNILHRTLQNQLVVIRRLATLSIGTYKVFFDNRADAFRLYSTLDRLDDFQYIDNDNPETNMYFAVSGRVLIDQEPWPGLRWTVSIPFEQTA